MTGADPALFADIGSAANLRRQFRAAPPRAEDVLKDFRRERFRISAKICFLGALAIPEQQCAKPLNL